jgi:glycosyltransferase involved in cell wall biosynthesis
LSGGAERQLVNLVASTDRQVVEHVVCVINEAEFFAPKIRAAGYRVIDFGLDRWRPIFAAALKLKKIIEREQPDVLHSWLYDAHVASRLALLPRSPRPVVASLQLPDYDPEAIQLAGWNRNKVRVLKAIDYITARFVRPIYVACSEFVRKSYLQHFCSDEARIHVIYNSVDPEFLNSSGAEPNQLRNEIGLAEDDFVFLNVGRLDPQKNHKKMFEALNLTKARLPNARLVLVGVGSMEAELRSLSREMGIDDRVKFLGRRSDVGAILEIADVFLFPSLFEGLGVALVEAMLKRRACIVSLIEVFEEIVEDGRTALLIDPASADEIANAMITLHANPALRRSLGENAFLDAEAKFTTSVTARKWEELYAEVSR